MSIEEKLKHIKEKLSKYSAVKNDDKVNQYLDELKKFSVNADLLMNTGLGIFVKELKKHNRSYSSKAAKLVDDWKKLINKEGNNNNTNNNTSNNSSSSSKKVSVNVNGQQQKHQAQNNSVNSNVPKKRKSTTNEHEQQKKQKLTLSDYIQKKGDQLQKSSTSLTGDDEDEENGDVENDNEDDFDCFDEQESNNTYNPSTNPSNEFDEFTNKIQKQLEKQKQQMDKNRDNSTSKKNNPAPPALPQSQQQHHKQAKKAPTSNSNNDRSSSSNKPENVSSTAKPPSKPPQQPQQQKSKQQQQQQAQSQKIQQPKMIEPPKPSLPLPNLSLPTPTIEITPSQPTTQNLNNNKSTATLVTQSQPIKINSSTDLSKYLNSRQSKRLLYTGKRDGPIVVPKLKEICLKALGDCIDDLPQRIYLCNINSNYEFRVAFDLIKPVLDRANFKQLMNIESYSPDFMEHTDKLWKNLCEEEFKGARPDEDETWRDLFLRMHDEREAKFQLARSRVSSQQANKPIERKTQILNNVNKPHSRSAAFIPLTKTTTTKSNKFGVQQTVIVNKSKPQVSSKPIMPQQSRPTGSLMQKTLKMMKTMRR